MDVLQLIVMQCIAHLLTDFTFRPEKNNLALKNKFIKWHFFIALALSWLLSLQLNFFFAAFCIALLHLIADLVKNYFNNTGILKKYAFLVSQTIHLIFMLSIVLIFNKNFEIKPLIDIPMSLKQILIVSGFVFCTKPANAIIKEVINGFDIKVNNDGNDDLPNAGKLIGIIERFLVLTFIILNQFETVGFPIAAKSILRFKEDNTIKTEYVLIGTMLSFGIAIASGIIINLL